MTGEFKGRIKKAILRVIGSGNTDSVNLEMLVEKELAIGISADELVGVLNELLDEHFIRIHSVRRPLSGKEGVVVAEYELLP